MTDAARKVAIAEALQGFGKASFYEAAVRLFAELGYKSGRKLRIQPGTPDNFLATLASDRPFNRAAALFHEWCAAEFLFQITTDEVQDASQGAFLFTGHQQFDPNAYESYLFVALELSAERYTRTQLAGLTRELNRLFPQPVMVLVKHGPFLSLAIIHRRPGRRDPSRDVLEKVTLIKDVRWAEPIRVHVDILAEFGLGELQQDFPFRDFAGLHSAWEKRLATYQVNEQFYRDVANWYFWALKHEDVVYPPDIRKLDERSEEGRELRSIFLIRLLTRLIFCWFLKEKGLIPPNLFRHHEAKRLLTDLEPKADTFYRAILQNLFFATLNVPCEDRKFIRKATYKGISPDFTNQYVFRYDDEFADLEAFNALMRDVPFLNGGLFECLDKKPSDDNPVERRLDGFSSTRSKQARLPNDLFFAEEHSEDLTEFYQDKKGAPKWAKTVPVSGLVTILSRYKFTVVENTPFEEEIALDPELLGKVFENLLASYNEDTRTTARKATGSFYTPREIVSYMVDGALQSYFEACLAMKEPADKGGCESLSPLADKLRALFAADPASYRVENHFSERQIVALINTIDRVKILDPACGSGAFPMGALHRLVDLLAKLDPNNRRWKEQQLARARADRRLAEQMQDEKIRERTLKEIEDREEDILRSFDEQFHELDFARKLYLIENGIFGVDIQPIATQIAKLRFFIALIVDQKADPKADNRGVRPLPNLETKLVAADFTVPVEKKLTQGALFDDNAAQLRRLEQMKEDLARVRHEHFNARNPRRKETCRKRDFELRRKMADLLRQTGMKAAQAEQLADWDPYDQNAHARFFDADWMFNFSRERMRERLATLRGNFRFLNETRGQMEIPEEKPEDTGFDIVIGNPPYIRLQTLKQKDPALVEFYKDEYISASKGNYDLYVVFVEGGLRLLQPRGNLAYILPHKFFNSEYGEPLRGFLAQGRHLHEIIHFGDHQVFPGPTNYVCLLFLHKTAGDSFRFVRPDNLDDWLKSRMGTEARFPSRKATADEWNFVVGSKAVAFEALERVPEKLGRIARIFQGMVTGCDDVFVVEAKSKPQNGLIHVVDVEENHWTLEASILKPFLKDVSVRRFETPTGNHFLIFPYLLNEGEAELLLPEILKQRFPRTWDYLKKHSTKLRAREGGSWDNEMWYAFARNQNLAQMGLPKLIVQVIAETAQYAIDLSGYYFTGGGNGPYYGLRWHSGHPESLAYLQALLNSQAVDFYLHQVSSPFRGGYWSYGKRFIEQLPIPTATPEQQALVERVVNYLLWLNRQAEVTDGTNPRELLHLAFWEQLINGLVYELFFPEELHAAGLHLFRLVTEASLPVIDSIPEPQRLARLRALGEQLNKTNHPLYAALFSLRGLETVRIIEGEP